MIDTKRTILVVTLLFIVIIVGAIIALANDLKLETESSINQEIALEENPSTGFSWFYIIEDPSIVQVTSDSYQATEGKEGMVGVGGIHTFYLEGLKEGTTTIKFDHYRSWEGIENAIDTKIFSVTVSADLKITEITELK